MSGRIAFSRDGKKSHVAVAYCFFTPRDRQPSLRAPFPQRFRTLGKFVVGTCLGCIVLCWTISPPLAGALALGGSTAGSLRSVGGLDDRSGLPPEFQCLSLVANPPFPQAKTLRKPAMTIEKDERNIEPPFKPGQALPVPPESSPNN